MKRAYITNVGRTELRALYLLTDGNKLGECVFTSSNHGSHGHRLQCIKFAKQNDYKVISTKELKAGQ